MDSSDLLHEQLVLAATKLLWRSPWDENGRVEASFGAFDERTLQLTHADDYRTDLFADARRTSYADVQPLRVRRYRSHSSPLVSPVLSEASTVCTPTVSPTLVYALPEPASPPILSSSHFDSETDSGGPSPATDYSQYFDLPTRPSRPPIDVPQLVLVQPTPMLQSPDLSGPSSPRTTLAVQRRRWSMTDSPSGCWCVPNAAELTGRYYPRVVDPTHLSPYALNGPNSSRHLVKSLQTQTRRQARWPEIMFERPAMVGPPTGLVNDTLRPILEPISPVVDRYGSTFGLGINLDYSKTPFNSPVRPRRQRS